MEEETRKMVWNGKIPVCFTLAEDENSVGGVAVDRAAPEPCYVRGYTCDTKHMHMHDVA